MTLTDGSLFAGDSCTFSVELDVAAGVSNGAYPNTTSEVTGTIDAEPVVGNPATDTLIVVGAPTLRKTFIDDPIAPGDIVTVEFTLVNGAFGDATSDESFPATDITFTDDLTFTTGLTVVTASLPTDPCGIGSILTSSSDDTLLTLAGGSLDPFESCTFSVTLQSSTSTPTGTATNTTSDVSATVEGTAVTGNGASDDLIVTDLTFSKEFTDDPVQAGDTVTLAFTITNDGTLDATGVFFTDDLDATLTGLVANGLPIPTACGTGSSVSVTGPSVLTFTGGTVTGGDSCTSL